MTRIFIERKRMRDGREKVYECSLIEKKGSELKLEHVMSLNSPYQDGVFVLPAGEILTRAFYWSDRRYLAYCLYDKSTGFLGTRFDICTISSITDAEIIWDDYILDLWAPIGGGIHLLDEDEYRAALASGMLTNSDEAWIEKAKDELMLTYQSIISSLMEE